MEILELSDKTFKEPIKMLQWAMKKMLETNENDKNLNREMQSLGKEMDDVWRTKWKFLNWKYYNKNLNGWAQ